MTGEGWQPGPPSDDARALILGRPACGIGWLWLAGWEGAGSRPRDRRYPSGWRRLVMAGQVGDGWRLDQIGRAHV